MKQGLIHIYCGDGKGKTSAATGLAVRAAGCGYSVLLSRFLKTEDSGELNVLDAVPGIEVIHLEKSYGFYRTLSQEEQGEVKDMYRGLWNRIRDQISGGGYDILVIDEFMAAYNYGLIPQEDAVRFLKQKPDSLEIVLTGRDPAKELVELADYVSEIRKVRHPFDRGIPARKGIEY